MNFRSGCATFLRGGLEVDVFESETLKKRSTGDPNYDLVEILDQGDGS